MLTESTSSLDGTADAACIVGALSMLKSPGRVVAKHLRAPTDEADDDHRQAERDQCVQSRLSPSGPNASLASCQSTAVHSGFSIPATNAAALDQVRRAATCGLCSSLVAGSLVLSCGHQFCGSCLFNFLNQKPSCPTCQVGLRAIPVRCLALDGVAEALGRVLSKSELDAYQARAEEGKSAANKINKMFWWLQPAAIPALGDAHGQQAAHGGPSNLPGAAAAAAAMALSGAPGVTSRVRAAASCGGAAGAPATRQVPQQRVTLDAHIAACTPAAQPHNPPPRGQQQASHGGALLPGFLDAIGLPHSQAPIYEDCGFGNRGNGGQGYGRDPLRTPFYNANGQRMGRQQPHRQFNNNAAVPGSIDSSHLVNLGLNPPLMSRAMHHQQQANMTTMPYFEYAPQGPGQGNLPHGNAAQLQYMPADYGLQAQGQSDAVVQAQLQQLLSSLALAEMHLV